MAVGLADVISRSDVHELARAIFVNDDGDWRLAVISPDVERLGRLAVARRLHAAAIEGGLGGEEIARLLVLGTADPDAGVLLTEGVGRGHGVPLEETPEFRGYILWRSPGGRRYVAKGVQFALRTALDAEGYESQADVRLPIGWRADLQVSRQGWSGLIEIATAEAKSWKLRLRDAAGVANVSGLPTVLVLISPLRLPDELLEPQGVVPVEIVDWQESGPPGVLRALANLQV